MVNTRHNGVRMVTPITSPTTVHAVRGLVKWRGRGRGMG